jgi:energy-coupling factor transporter ATP-binding protein EcfA2
MFTWRIGNISFSGGETIRVEPDSLLLLIGPNSSGKSSALRNIDQGISLHYPGPVIEHVSVQRGGDYGEFKAWFDENYPKRFVDGDMRYLARQIGVAERELPNYWQQGDHLSGLKSYLCASLDTASRTTIANYTQAIDVWNAMPAAFVHQLQTSPDLLREVNSWIRSAFGRELVIDWTAAPRVGFRVGVEPERTAEEDRVSEKYADALRKLPSLDEEGDGIKSFAGCILATLCGSQPLLLIDEPEAFLHPPQARRLGAALAQAASDKGRQVIVATHSADVVQGALNSGRRVAVCRLTRDGDRNHGTVLEADQLAELWAKPLLRSAAAINGLFHSGVVVCEGDSDARLYDAVLRRAEDKGRIATSDFYFVHGGGKGNLTTLASAYHSLQTRTAVIADIDLMRNQVEHYKTLAALGGDLDVDDVRYKAVINALKDAAPLMPLAAAVDELRKVADGIESRNEIATDDRKRIQKVVYDSAKFSEAKSYGITKLRGQPRAFAKELLHEWRLSGLFIVPVGELEGWWPEGPANDKGEWIAKAVELVDDREALIELEDFIVDLAAFFAPTDSAVAD